MEQLAIVKKYFQLVENFSVDKTAYEQLLHPGISQVAFPNLVTREIRKRGFSDLLAGVAAGKQILKYQRFSIVKSFATENALVVEATWTGETSVKLGAVAADTQLKAYICSVFEFRDGKIHQQRNYDCYEPIPQKRPSIFGV